MLLKLSIMFWSNASKFCLLFSNHIIMFNKLTLCILPIAVCLPIVATYFIGASLSEPQYVGSTVKSVFSLACLHVCPNLFYD